MERRALVAIALFAFSNFLFADSKSCFYPSSEREACLATALSLNCSQQAPPCCMICPATSCAKYVSKPAVIGTKFYGLDSYICTAARHAGLFGSTCGASREVSFEMLDYSAPFLGSIKFGISSTTKSNTRNKTIQFVGNTGALSDSATLVQNFRVLKTQPPVISCMTSDDVNSAQMGPSVFQSENNKQLPWVSPKWSSIKKGGSRFTFDLSTNSPQSWINSFQCNFNTSQGPRTSPVGIAFIGQTTRFTQEPSVVAVRLSPGDPLNVQVKTGAQSLKWQRNGNLIAEGPRMQLHSVTCADAGLYRVYDSIFSKDYSSQTQGLMLVTVTEEKGCSNGGVMSSGSCICPPGLYGKSCTFACQGLRLGRSCGLELPVSSHQQLKGALLCLPGPYGCECVPGFTGLKCDKSCPVGQFGRNCIQNCHCKSGHSECSPYNGFCLSGGCDKGFDGDNCQRVCDNKTYGSHCKETCHCNDPTDCDPAHGPRQNCTCEPRWTGSNCSIPFENATVTSLTVTRVNPGEQPVVKCSGKSVPLPKLNQFSLVADGKVALNVTLQKNQSADGMHVTTDAAPPLVESKSVKITCCLKTASGNDCGAASVVPFTPLRLRKLPEIGSTGPDFIKVRFDGWNSKTGTGDGPALEYRLCYRMVNSTTWSYTPPRAVGCNSCVLLASGLRSQTAYDVAVSVRRPGKAPWSWGPCTPSVREITLPVTKTNRAEVSQLLTLAQQNHEMLTKLSAVVDKLALQQAQCCCSATSTRPPQLPTTKATSFDCTSLYEFGYTNEGVRVVMPQGLQQPISVWCQHGWTVIQARSKSNLVNFNRTLEDYEDGFGKPGEDQWIGLKFLEKVTAQKNYKMRIEFLLSGKHDTAQPRFLEHGHFKVKGKSDMYALDIGKYISTNIRPGNLTKSMVTGSTFNTYFSCSRPISGGWWSGCSHGALLNAQQRQPCYDGACLMIDGFEVVATQMMIRPADA